MRYTHAIQVAKHNTNENVWDAFLPELDGVVRIKTPNGTDTDVPVTAGTIYPIATLMIYDTGTTAGEVVGLV